MTKGRQAGKNEMAPQVQLFGLRGDASTADARRRLEAIGVRVVETTCPRGTADWVQFPFVREPSGAGYYGDEAIDAFIKRAEKARGSFRP